MRFQKVLFTAIFCVLCFSFAPAAAVDSPIAPAPSIPKPSGEYWAGDLYILDRGERKTLQLYPRSLVLRPFAPLEDREKFKEFLKQYELTPEKGVRVEEITAHLGTKNAKTAVGKKNYFVVTFSKDVDVLALIKKMRAEASVWEAHPVFFVDDEYVFPAGIWVRVKTITVDSKTYLHKRIQGYGYARAWEKTPLGVDSRSLYYVPAGPDFQNPLSMSRLIAEDLVVESALPDFVSIQPLVKFTRDISRPSGALHDPFIFTYTISYNHRRVVIDVAKIRQWDEAALRPEGLLEELFKLEGVQAKDEKGIVTVRIPVRFYQPGDFELAPPPVFYSIKGADPDIPPLEFGLGKTGFKIVGLVPRDAAGSPRLSDIRDWKTMPPVSLDEPARPQKVDYPWQDLRYWSKHFATKNASLIAYAKTAGAWLGGLSAAGLLFIGFVRGGRVVLRQHRYKGRRSEFSRVVGSVRGALYEGGSADGDLVRLFVRESRARLRDILGFDGGATSREMLQNVPACVCPVLEVALKRIDMVEAAGELTAAETENIVSFVWDVRRAKRRDAVMSFFRHTVLRRKREG